MDYNPVGWFEIPVTDMDRAKQFYESLLNITLTQREFPGYEMFQFPSMDGVKGISGALFKGMGYEPSASGVVVYFTTPDIDETIKRAEELGATIKLPKKDLGENGFIAWLSDSEGNTIALHRAK